MLATVPFTFRSNQEASLVEIAGSFNNWTKVGMIKDGGHWRIYLKMKPGVHQYKYIVDGKWEHGEGKPTTNDNMGGLNNVINVDDKDENITPESHHTDADLFANLLGSDWIKFARELDIEDQDINLIMSEYPDNVWKQAMVMLRLWLNTEGNQATGNALEKALRKCDREDIVNKCIFNKKGADSYQVEATKVEVSQAQESSQAEDVVAVKENEAGLISRPGATGKFYCGGDLGESRHDLCPCCTGCGPDAGCNCAPCQKLDIASRKLPKNYYVNREGAACRRSTVSGLFHCGRPIYEDNSTVRCGPDGGEQCKWCQLIGVQVENAYRGVWRQDTEESTLVITAPVEDVISTKTNEAGQISRPGATGKFYCGGDLDEDLCSCTWGGRGKCVGCGPHVGCNCAPCQKIDIATRKLPKNFYVNREGATCRRSSETGLIYCGRKVANSGDGHCGPSDGPQCQMCSLIQNQVDGGGYRGVW